MNLRLLSSSEAQCEEEDSSAGRVSRYKSVQLLWALHIRTRLHSWCFQETRHLEYVIIKLKYNCHCIISSLISEASLVLKADEESRVFTLGWGLHIGGGPEMILQSCGLFRLPWVKVWLSVHSSEPPPLQRWLLEVDINKLLKRLSSHEFPAWWAAGPWVCRALTWPLGWACLGLTVMLGLRCNGKLCMEKVSPTILPHKEWQSSSAWVSDSQEDLRED